ncbi:flavin-containing monooxygenase [Alkalicoccobacillus plakortidis]|uniref:NAD(P)/FAD-dependent oxidoreductase n=1 Tax=Alkalicoccobacillus plakortidis TaxID=444060 RepID=A0ABT0XNH9_9BACI|nr:NAD(P)/FAD-dependent oxidoreductase [Alkalicoccobacillus plakortidis]MCM2677462.1 NAD(P)/FAD-dependent oxidoreductase [Alkalicoccobacillus plakortidis]
MIDTYEVLIIGGGQAGLAMAYALKQQNTPYIILDENEKPGASWEQRYDSLTLFTPRNYSSLYEYNIEGEPKGFPSKGEIASYMRKFILENDLSIKHNEKVWSVAKNKNNTFSIESESNTYVANQVVVATGAFHDPFIPNIHDQTIPFMIHSSEYKNSNQVPEGKVLIVGSGNTGVQIAAELSHSHDVILSSSKKIKNIPNQIVGKSLFWWLDVLGISKATPHSLVGKFLQKRDPIIGNDYKRVKKQVKRVSRLMKMEQGKAYFQKDRPIEINSIIWATGYRNRYDWIHIEGVIDLKGKPVHTFGESTVKGLYFIGLSWQSRRSSALIYGVEKDANYVAQLVIKRQKS